ncbi:MAG: YeeE/YedE family protein [Sporomusaceae bacterium]|nr:YeeE/YedE family protein [Sporomusaceae bacterium]
MSAVFGARLADGCPSGHGLSGVLQLATSGFIALVAFFIGGLISAIFVPFLLASKLFHLSRL